MRRAVAGVLLLAAIACRARPESPAPSSSLARPTPQVVEPGLEFLDGTKDGTPESGGTLYRRLAGAPRTPQVVEPGLEFLDGTKDGTPESGGTLYRRLAGDPTTLNAVLQSGVFEAQ